MRCPTVAGRDRIAQILSNLLDNARHASSDRGTITVAVTSTGERATLTVTDTGPGIPAGERERIFERVVCLDPARARNRFGSGLGLPITRRIAHTHAGRLRCLPSPHRRALRARAPSASPASARAPSQPGAGGTSAASPAIRRDAQC